MAKLHVNRLLVAAATAFLPVSVMAAPPDAQPDTRSIPEDSSITINVIANDFDTDGDTLIVQSVTQPQEGAGSTTLNADGSILFTAAPGFVGDAVFEYILADSAGEVAEVPGIVTVSVVSNQFQPFATNANDDSLAEALFNTCLNLRNLDDAELGAGQRQLLDQCLRIESLAASSPEAVAEALNQLAPEETITQMRVAIDANRSQVRAVSQRVQQQRFASRDNRQGPALALNGRHWILDTLGGQDEGAESAPAIWSRLGLFANMQTESAERDKTSLENGYDADAFTFTVGADYFLSQSWLVGATWGYNSNELDYENDDGELESELSTLSAFGAFFHKQFAVYAQAGYSWMEFDSKRSIEFGTGDITFAEVVTSETKGNQFLFNTRAEWEWRQQALLITPFIRADYIESDIDGFGEQGSGGVAMSMSDQSTSQLTLAGGVQSAYTLKASWGVWTPTIGLTYLSETESDRDPIRARFAAAPDESFVMINDGGDKDFYEVSVGTTAVFPRGVSGFFEYTRLLDYEHLDVEQFQLGLRLEL